MSKVLIAIDKSQSYRVYLTISTEVVEMARKIHNTSPLATAGLGRVLTATGIMSVMMKDDSNRLTVQFKGDGPAKQILSCGYGDGRIKGFISNPIVELPLTKERKLDVGGSLGVGELTVIRDTGGKEPYTGTIALVSGEIADDLTAYWYISEQQNTSIALGVKVSREKNVLAAGGMFIQMLPEAQDAAVDSLELMLQDMKPITTLVEETILQGKGKSEQGLVDDLMKKIFSNIKEDFVPEILGYKDIKLECDCSKERMAKALMAIGERDLNEIIEKDGQAELGCRFCESKYTFTIEELKELLVAIKR